MLLCGASLSCSFNSNKAPDEKIKVAEGYSWEVYAEGLKSVDNLAKTPDGLLFATLELNSPDGELIMIDRDGKATSVMKGLNRPDGLRARGFKLYILEESRSGRVIEYDVKAFKHRVMAEFDNLEGIAVISDEEIVIAEDKKEGRLIKLSLSGDRTVLWEGLSNPEGIAVDKEGVIYIAETKTGKVLFLKGDEKGILLQGLHEPDQLAIDNDGALWIAEDVNPGRLLRYYNGLLETIVEGLNAPQGILTDGKDILLAEQELGRIIHLKRKQK
ncbi:MAG: SdiA-regulated domain-containing protein [Thermodesulfovibrionia bacterium]|nr:SdiA-regulated domain-containing protein [Thermodesulfovibrionia bacterium]